MTPGRLYLLAALGVFVGVTYIMQWLGQPLIDPVVGMCICVASPFIGAMLAGGK